MPSEMQLLLKEYPREDWPAHPGFKEKTKGWLRAHQMFRRLSASIEQDIESFLDRNTDSGQFVSQLQYRGSMLVSYLHGHHGWEDRSYFPELLAADARFGAGIKILENDHKTLHTALDQFTETANTALKSLAQNQSDDHANFSQLHTAAHTIKSLLQRHLGDEEELAVPIILHYRLRG